VQLTLQNFTTLVQNMAASAQGACAELTDITVGSVTRALLEASASIALWLQYLIVQTLSMTRLATSSGTDVDSWVNDFGLTRLPAVQAVGSVTLTSLSPQSQSAVIAVGTIVKTSDGLLSFSVTEDMTNTAWSASTQAYVRPVGTAAVTVPIEAAVAGSAGNVQAGTINLLGQSVVGIDTVTNSLALTSGLDGESDASVRARFVLYINSLSRATSSAIVNAALAVRQGLTATVLENTDASGDSRLGTLTVVVDDGSGSPSTALLASVAAAVDPVRPVGAIVSVVGPTLLPVDLAMTLTLAPGANFSTVQQNVVSALTTYVDGLPVGGVMAFARLAYVVFQADGNVANVAGLTANGVTADLGGGAAQVVRARTVTVS
jgi:uncharacterized phage protein gp47/JayE